MNMVLLSCHVSSGTMRCFDCTRHTLLCLPPYASLRFDVMPLSNRRYLVLSQWIASWVVATHLATSRNTSVCRDTQFWKRWHIPIVLDIGCCVQRQFLLDVWMQQPSTRTVHLTQNCIVALVCRRRGVRWRRWLLTYCARGRKVAVSVPDRAMGFNPSGHTMALGSIQPLTEMSSTSICCEVKAAVS